MQAVILAGGFGTRLKSVMGEGVPKPMVAVNGEPFLAHLLRYAAGQGVREAVLSLHHHASHIQRYFGAHFEGVRLRYAIEETPLGTGGALAFSLSILKPEAPVLVMNGDCFVRADYAPLMEAHITAGASLTMALKAVDSCARFGQVMCDARGRIAEFYYPGNDAPGFISTGLYVVNPDIFQPHNLPPAFSFERDFQVKFLHSVPMHGYAVEGYFIDIGIPEDYARFCREFSALQVA